MEPIVIGILGLIILFVLLAIGAPVGFGMALVGIAGLSLLLSPYAAIIKVANSCFSTITDYSLAVLPMFIIMAEVILSAGLSKDLYNLTTKWIGHLPGGIGMATIGACGAFSAVSSSSIATAVTMGSVALPEMKKAKYDPKFATGIVAGGGTLGILIPPSGALIMYGVITQQSIGTLFIAGIVPGIMLALLFMLTIYISGRIKPSLCPKGPRTKLKEKFYAFGQCGEIIVLIFLVLGGLLIGWFTPTEAGAVGVFGAIAISMARKRLKWRSFTDALKRAAKTIGMIYIILIGAFILNYFMTVSTIPDRLASLVSALPLPPLAIIAVVVLIYMFLGCFLDAAAMVLLTVPIFFPMIVSLGFDPIWFGILVVLTCEMAMITPPIGMNVYAINGIAPDVTMSGIFKGVIPFFLMLFLFTIFIVLVPQVVLFLPNNL